MTDIYVDIVYLEKNNRYLEGWSERNGAKTLRKQSFLPKSINEICSGHDRYFLKGKNINHFFYILLLPF